MADGKRPVYEHIGELRDRVIISLFFILIFSVLSYYFYNIILNLLIKPLNRNLIFLAPQDAFIIQLKISIFTGLSLAFPIIVYNFYRFLSLGLKKKKILISFFLLLSILLFILSLIFTYLVAMPVGLKFLLSFGNDALQPQISVDKYFSFIFSLFFSFVFIFQLPLIILSLNKIGILNKEILTSNRKFAILIMLVVAAIITPPDAITMFFLVIPLIILYELGIILIRIFN